MILLLKKILIKIHYIIETIVIIIVIVIKVIVILIKIKIIWSCFNLFNHIEVKKDCQILIIIIIIVVIIIIILLIIAVKWIK